MSWHISAPSKTFLVGEYVALQGGPAIVLTTMPRFELRINTQPQTDQPVVVQGIQATSPAGRFLQQTTHDWQGLSIHWVDPHQGAGGFGASSAQLAMLLAFTRWRQHRLAPAALLSDSEALLQLYRKFAWNGEGIAPSGADFIAQWQGGISLWQRQAQKLLKLAWPFAALEIVLIRTGQKLATYQHLQTLPAIDWAVLHQIAQQAWQSLQTAQQSVFIAAINAYTHALQQQGLVAPHTLQLLIELQQRPEVLAAKGCGALGADVVLAVVAKSQRAIFADWLHQQGLSPVFMGQTTSDGIVIEKNEVA